MSDISSTAVEEAAPVADETAPVIEPTESAAPAVDERTLDLTEYGDYKVPVKVGGEERFVPITEVVNGHMMQADYTRKTQELAAERETLVEARAIREALEKDPEGTLKVLNEYYASNDDELENLDPQERAIKEIQDRFAEQDRQAEEAALHAELERFQSEKGVDPDALLRFAVENQIPDLNWAYAVMAQGRTEAEQTIQQQTAAAEAARTAAKAGSVVVEGGADRASNASSAPTGDRASVRSVADAFALAKSQLGGR